MTTTTAPAPADTPTPVRAGRPRARRARRVRREWPGRLVTLLGLLLGLGIILFPVGGTYYNNWQAHQFAREQAERQLTAPNGKVSSVAALDAARAYNSRLPETLLSDPWNGAKPEGTSAYTQYSRELGGARGVMGVLRVPSVASELPIMHGTSEWSLDRGAGHMFGTSLPVGGSGTHAALAAHRGLPQMTAFDRLPEVEVGDQFFLDVGGETLAYRVQRLDTVLPTDIRRLARVPGQDLVTLITCTPYGINSHRLLVTGVRIPWSEADPSTRDWHGFDWSIQSWMWLRIGAAALTLLLVVGMVIGWVRSDRRWKRRVAARLSTAQGGDEGSGAGALAT